MSKGGGSCKYLDDIMQRYKHNTFIPCNTPEELQQYANDDCMLIMHHLFNTTITINNIINAKRTKLIIGIHDMYWISNILFSTIQNADNPWHTNYLKSDITINSQFIKLFKSATHIIFPSKFVYDIYVQHYGKMNNFFIQPHNDIPLSPNNFYIPPITDNTINYAILHPHSPLKGQHFVEYLKSTITTYKNYTINYLIIGNNLPKYNENEFFDLITKYNIHCTSHLHAVGETYCYCLTKIMNSGLPFMYDNFGSFKERINHEKENVFKVFENEDEIENLDKLTTTFCKMLDYVIKNNGKYSQPTYDATIRFHAFYDGLFA
jgi:hypothetical protein